MQQKRHKTRGSRLFSEALRIGIKSVGDDTSPSYIGIND